MIPTNQSAGSVFEFLGRAQIGTESVNNMRNIIRIAVNDFMSGSLQVPDLRGIPQNCVWPKPLALRSPRSANSSAAGTNINQHSPTQLTLKVRPQLAPKVTSTSNVHRHQLHHRVDSEFTSDHQHQITVTGTSTRRQYKSPAPPSSTIQSHHHQRPQSALLCLSMALSPSINPPWVLPMSSAL